MLCYRDRSAHRRAATVVRLVVVALRRRRDRTAVDSQAARADFDTGVAAYGCAIVHDHIRITVQCNARMRISRRTSSRCDRTVDYNVNRVVRIRYVADHEQRAVQRTIDRYVDRVRRRIVRAEDVQCILLAGQRDALADGQRTLRCCVFRVVDLNRCRTGVRRRDDAADRGSLIAVHDVQRARSEGQPARGVDVVTIQVKREVARRVVAAGQRRIRQQRHRRAARRIRCRPGICEGLIALVVDFRNIDLLNQFVLAGIGRALDPLEVGRDRAALRVALRCQNRDANQVVFVRVSDRDLLNTAQRAAVQRDVGRHYRVVLCNRNRCALRGGS